MVGEWLDALERLTFDGEIARILWTCRHNLETGGVCQLAELRERAVLAFPRTNS